MGYKSNIYLCVPGCTQGIELDFLVSRSAKIFDKNGSASENTARFGPHFKLTEATKVCSLHFHPSDVKKGIGGIKV